MGVQTAANLGLKPLLRQASVALLDIIQILVISKIILAVKVVVLNDVYHFTYLYTVDGVKEQKRNKI